MILKVGIDIVATKRLENMFKLYNDNLINKILSEDEIKNLAYLKKDIVPLLSKRVAAKEASVKALGTGFSGGIGWKDIYIYHENKQPMVEFRNKAKERFNQLGANFSTISISDEKNFAIAVVAIYK